MKKFFVERRTTTYLLRDEHGTFAGEWAMEVGSKRPTAMLRLPGHPEVRRELRWAPDSDEEGGLCRDMLGELIGDAELEIDCPGTRLNNSYRTTEAREPNHYELVDNVLRAYSSWKKACKDEDRMVGFADEMLEALAKLYEHDVRESLVDEIGRQYWWSTCVLCGKDYRHYFTTSWYDEHGTRIQGNQRRNIEGVHTDERLCEVCAPGAVHHHMGFGFTDEGRPAVVVIGGHTVASSFTYIASGTRDGIETLRGMYQWLIDLLQEKKT